MVGLRFYLEFRYGCEGAGGESISLLRINFSGDLLRFQWLSTDLEVGVL